MFGCLESSLVLKNLSKLDVPDVKPGVSCLRQALNKAGRVGKQAQMIARGTSTAVQIAVSQRVTTKVRRSWKSLYQSLTGYVFSDLTKSDNAKYATDTHTKLVSGFSLLRGEQTHKLPSKTTLDRATFLWADICSCHTRRNGRTRIATSVSTFGIALP